MTGAAEQIWLNDPETGIVDHVWILGDGDDGKSTLLRVVLMEAVGSGFFCIVPSDRRNEHGFDRFWDQAVDDPAWIATNVADTVKNVEAGGEDRQRAGRVGERAEPDRGASWSCVRIDDADDVLRLLRGRELIDFIVTHGPAVGVGLVSVIRDLDCVDGDEVLCRAIADARGTIFVGPVMPDRWNEFRSEHRSRPRHE